MMSCSEGLVYEKLLQEGTEEIFPDSQQQNLQEQEGGGALGAMGSMWPLENHLRVETSTTTPVMVDNAFGILSSRHRVFHEAMFSRHSLFQA